MSSARRWDPSVTHRDDGVRPFVTHHFGASDRRVLFIGGAGFDPRSRIVAKLLSDSGVPIRALLIQEERPNPAAALVDRAARNTAALVEILPENELTRVDIFGSDNAVIGGRSVVMAVHRQPVSSFTDVVVDISALSIGTSFPIIRYLVEILSTQHPHTNLHIFVAHAPATDEAIRPVAGDTPGFVHGFQGTWGLDATAKAARLWLPQLAMGRRTALQRLYDFVEPHDTCPILPFPAMNPRAGDELSQHYLTEFESTWAVDTRNIIYAAEHDPIDLYRTILRMDDLRRAVFSEVGGSLLVLSPVGSKVMALGALLAALEGNLPVAYLESIGYELEPHVPSESSEQRLIHVWLEGDVYPLPRAALRGGEPS